MKYKCSPSLWPQCYFAFIFAGWLWYGSAAHIRDMPWRKMPSKKGIRRRSGKRSSRKKGKIHIT